MSAESKPLTGEERAAVLLGLPLRLEVILDAQSDETLRFITHGHRLAQARSDYWLALLPWYAGMAIGIYGCLQADQVFLAVMILLIWGFLFRHHLAIQNASIFGGVQEVFPLSVTILVTDSGMSEFDRGVESKFDWSAMRRWFLCRSTLLIELTNAKWAIIPAKGLVPTDTSLERLCSLLKIKGVSGKQLDL